MKSPYANLTAKMTTHVKGCSFFQRLFFVYFQFIDQVKNCGQSQTIQLGHLGFWFSLSDDIAPNGGFDIQLNDFVVRVVDVAENALHRCLSKFQPRSSSGSSTKKGSSKVKATTVSGVLRA